MLWDSALKYMNAVNSAFENCYASDDATTHLYFYSYIEYFCWCYCGRSV